MDIVIKDKKKISRLRRHVLIAVLAVPATAALWYLWYLGQADFSLDRDTLVFSEVKRGNFTVSVRASGLLVPDVIRWLSSNVEGTVVSIALKAGSAVKVGDHMLELANPELQQQLAEAQWEMEATEAELIAETVTLESELQQQRSAVLNAELEYEQSVAEYMARDELIETGAVSRLDHRRARVEMDQQKQRWLSSQEQLERLQENLSAQKNARSARLNQMKNRVGRIQQQVSDLQIRASMAGTIQEMPLELGERIVMGTNVAKLAQQDSLIAELQVPEYQVRDVAIGQRVIVDTRNNTVEGLVSRVDPAVINGNVQVDVVFTESLPDDARPDLSVDGEIRIAEIPDTLYVVRPLFSQSRSHSAFYRLSDDRRFAERVKVTTGLGSVNQIQVLEGLDVGDQVITSDPTRFETYQKLRIN